MVKILTAYEALLLERALETALVLAEGCDEEAEIKEALSILRSLQRKELEEVLG